MKTLTLNESHDWCRDCGIELDRSSLGVPPAAEGNALRLALPAKASRLTWFSRVVEESIQPWERCLLLVTGWGVWASSENWHLYYRLRQSYGDKRLLEEAPGHLFLGFEANDLVSFLELGIVFGWDMHVVPAGGYGRVFISHDEWIQFVMSDESKVTELKASLRDACGAPISA